MNRGLRVVRIELQKAGFNTRLATWFSVLSVLCMYAFVGFMGYVFKFPQHLTPILKVMIGITAFALTANTTAWAIASMSDGFPVLRWMYEVGLPKSIRVWATVPFVWFLQFTIFVVCGAFMDAVGYPPVTGYMLDAVFVSAGNLAGVLMVYPILRFHHRLLNVAVRITAIPTIAWLQFLVKRTGVTPGTSVMLVLVSAVAVVALQYASLAVWPDVGRTHRKINDVSMPQRHRKLSIWQKECINLFRIRAILYEGLAMTGLLCLSEIGFRSARGANAEFMFLFTFYAALSGYRVIHALWRVEIPMMPVWQVVGQARVRLWVAKVIASFSLSVIVNNMGLWLALVIGGMNIRPESIELIIVSAVLLGSATGSLSWMMALRANKSKDEFVVQIGPEHQFLSMTIAFAYSLFAMWLSTNSFMGVWSMAPAAVLVSAVCHISGFATWKHKLSVRRPMGQWLTPNPWTRSSS